MSTAIFWILAIVMMALGIYTNFSNWKVYFEAKKVKEKFMKDNKGAEVARITKWRSWMFSLAAIACLCFGALLLNMESPGLETAAKWAQAAVYLAIAVYLVGMAVEAQTFSKVCYTADGFVYSTAYVRFKSIMNVEVGHGIFKNSYMNLTGGKQTAIPKYLAEWIEQHWLDWKQARNEKRKKRSRR